MPPRLTTLPIELIFQITDHLPLESIYKLCQTNGLLHNLLSAYLYGRVLEEHNGSPGLALLSACRLGNLALVRFLLDFADSRAALSSPIPLPSDLISFVNASVDQETSLIAAVRGDRECVLRIYRFDECEYETSERPADRLVGSEKMRREAIARLLLIRGVDFDGVDENLKSALHYSAQYGDTDIVRLLLLCGANATNVDFGHLTPLHLAVHGGHLDTVRALLEFEAVAKTIDVLTEDEDTALIIAAEGGYVDIVELLLKHGADHSIRNAQGESPLHLAALRGNIDVAKVLFQHGANLDGCNNFGHTPLQTAEQSGLDDVCLLFQCRALVSGI